MPCPRCQELIELRETRGQWKGRGIRYWSDCGCVTRGIAKYQALTDASAGYQAIARGGPQSDTRAVQHMTFATFDATRYPPLNNPATEARAWLDAALPQPIADYHRGAVCCLYLYSPGKGRGKTHLAAAVAAEAEAASRVAFFADEIAYINRYWAADLDEKAAMALLAGSQAWLTVIDDLGQRERATDTLRDAWYDVFNRRWLKRGWTVVTSNYTPDELKQRGTINDATYSRLAQMCNRNLITFASGDYRLESQE